MNIVKDISLKGKQYIKPVAVALAVTYLLSEFICEVATVEGQTFTNSEILRYFFSSAGFATGTNMPLLLRCCVSHVT